MPEYDLEKRASDREFGASLAIIGLGVAAMILVGANKEEAPAYCNDNSSYAESLPEC